MDHAPRDGNGDDPKSRWRPTRVAPSLFPQEDRPLARLGPAQRLLEPHLSQCNLLGGDANPKRFRMLRIPRLRGTTRSLRFQADVDGDAEEPGPEGGILAEGTE